MNFLRASRCKWVAFDAVGTLIEPTPSVAVVYASIGNRYGAQLSEDEVRQRFHQLFSARQFDLETDEQTELNFWREIVVGVLADAGQNECCFQELYAHFARPESWSVNADVVEMFEALQQRGIQIAVASNFDHRLHAVIDGYPELSPILHRHISAEIGWRKPSPAFFELLWKNCGCLPEEIMMVGDDLNNDVIAARNAGVASVHYVPTIASSRIIEDVEVPRISALRDLLSLV